MPHRVLAFKNWCMVQFPLFNFFKNFMAYHRQKGLELHRKLFLEVQFACNKPIELKKFRTSKWMYIKDSHLTSLKLKFEIFFTNI